MTRLHNTIIVLGAVVLGVAVFGARQPRAITAYKLVLLDEQGEPCASLCGGNHVLPDHPPTPYLHMNCPLDMAGESDLSNEKLNMHHQDWFELRLDEWGLNLSKDSNRAEVTFDRIHLHANGQRLVYTTYGGMSDDGKIELSDTARKRSLSIGTYRLRGNTQAGEWECPKP